MIFNFLMKMLLKIDFSMVLFVGENPSFIKGLIFIIFGFLGDLRKYFIEKEEKR